MQMSVLVVCPSYVRVLRTNCYQDPGGSLGVCPLYGSFWSVSVPVGLSLPDSVRPVVFVVVVVQ